MDNLTRAEDRATDVAVVVRLGGEYSSLNEWALSAVEDLLLRAANVASPPKLLVDFERTRFFGAGMIRVLRTVCNKVTATQGQMMLAGLQPYLAELLEVTKLRAMWRIHPDAGSALRALPASVAREGGSDEASSMTREGVGHGSSVW